MHEYSKYLKNDSARRVTFRTGCDNIDIHFGTPKYV